MKHTLAIAITLALAASAPVRAEGTHVDPVGATRTLFITGSTTMAPLVRSIAGRFETIYPGVRVEVHGGGSGTGLAELRAGRADIAMFSRAPGDREADVYGFPIARDGVAIIVNRANPVSALSRADVARIFRGRVSRWKTVGGRDVPIVG